MSGETEQDGGWQDTGMCEQRGQLAQQLPVKEVTRLKKRPQSTSASSVSSRRSRPSSLVRSESSFLVDENLTSLDEGSNDDVSSVDGSAKKWYRELAKPKFLAGERERQKKHPYKLRAITHQGDVYKRELDRYDDVKFWPFVGALKPWRSPEGSHDWNWDEYEGTVALCGVDTIVIGRCTVEKAWETLQEITIPDEILYTLAWTYHPFTCHPLVAVAGHLGLIYVIDVMTKECIRSLKGHGDEILCLDFAPNSPHILASSSSDRTTRIWNILGTSAPPPLPGDEPSENYPMGDADEGNVLVAILAGEGKGGHRSFVVSCAFHPTKRAIATCGMDYCVKIWPLPLFPNPSIEPPPTPRGYRAKIVHFPLFSTSRLHSGYLDWVDWISDDVLLVRGEKIMMTWQWLGYRRYFRDEEYAPLSMDPVYSDYVDSGSFMVISRYPTSAEIWYQNMGLHRAFLPTPADRARFPQNASAMVTDPLFACAHQPEHRVRKRKQKVLPEVRLYNPLLERDGAPPKPLTELRYEVQETYTNDHEQAPSEDDDSDFSPSRQTRGQKRRASRAKSREKPSGSKVDAPAYENPWLRPWRLQSSVDLRADSWAGYQYPTGIYNVAISPRGAKWILGVGRGMSIYVWEL